MRNIVILLCAILLNSCDSDDPLGQTDYRDGFVGTYDGWRRSTTWIMGQPTQTTFDGSDTYVVTSVDDSSLSINGGDAFNIGADGQYSQFSGGSNYVNIQFMSPDSLYFTWSSGGLGGNSTTNFRGKKVH